MTNLIQFDGFENEQIRVTEDGRYSVYDVIKFCGKKNPREAWKALVTQYSEVVRKTDNLKFPGPGQRETPVANKENILYIIGLLPGAIGKAYREAAAKVFLAYLDASPELASDIIDRATPDDLKKIEQRLRSKKIRVTFTQVLQDHGVTEGWQFAACTNAIYKPLLGGMAKQIKEERGLAKSDNLRDAMSLEEMAATMFAETLASKKIEEQNIQGFPGCRDKSKTAAEKVKELMDTDF